jgi:hypothetical protein
VIVSDAHVDEDERALVLGVLLEEVLAWVRSLPGSQRLRALVMFDEVYGFLPPHPANPPTKRPLVALMKQARAFGVGVLVATQNPMDLDYRALGNAGLWSVGRLQTDADRPRVIEGLAAAAGAVGNAKELSSTIKRLAPRWFVMRDAHEETAEFARVRRAMIVEEDLPCRICGVWHSTLKKKRLNPYAAKQMEAHHSVIEWAFMNAVVLSKFQRLVVEPRVSMDPARYGRQVGARLVPRKFSAKEMRAWIDHDRDNLWALCDVHHRHVYFGVHAVTGPVWEAQRLVKVRALTGRP